MPFTKILDRFFTYTTNKVVYCASNVDLSSETKPSNSHQDDSSNVKESFFLSKIFKNLNSLKSNQNEDNQAHLSSSESSKATSNVGNNENVHNNHENTKPSTNVIPSDVSSDLSTDKNSELLGNPFDSRNNGPIQFEQYGKEFQNMTMQDNFDGFRLEAVKNVNKYLQTCHSLFLGTQIKSCGYLYQFGPSFVIDDGSLLLMARASTDSSVSLRFLKKIGKKFEVKINANSSLVDKQRNMLELSLDQYGSDYCTSLKLAHQGTLILNGAFSQMLTPKLHLGGELTWIAANCVSIGAVGGNYINGKNIFSAQINSQPDFKSPIGLVGSDTYSCRLQYVRKITDRLNAGVELEYTHRDSESALKIGWEYLFRQARIQGLIDTCGKISVFAQDTFGFGISGMIDYWKEDYKFGFMMHIMPPAANSNTNISGGTAQTNDYF